MKESARFYHDNASKLVAQYEAVRAEDVHACWSRFLPETKGLILDVGAGSGRDSAWLVSRGHEVLAVEPAENLRLEAMKRHPEAAIQWLDDALPDFKAVEGLNLKFDLILLSGIWMHINPREERPRAFRKLAGLLKPGGKLVFCLRNQPPTDRPVHETKLEELLALANDHLLELKMETVSPDVWGRLEVEWTTVVFELRDDGTRALPLLRHIIINDAKSSTYKLALLRVLARIADGSPGMVLSKDEEFVTLPLGLVALYWVRIFKPLVLDADFQQQPSSTAGLGFAKAAFKALRQVSATDLRTGATFQGHEALTLATAIRDASSTIEKNPSIFTKFPSSKSVVFPCERERHVSIRPSVSLDRQFLTAMGTLRVPIPVWEALAQYACWIEPAIIEEWANLMLTYERAAGKDKPFGEYIEALRWPEYEHDTGAVRKIVEVLRKAGKTICCVWSGKPLSKDFAVDHILPFACWPNNDLWNLIPACPSLNLKKGDKLVGAETLERSRERILEWWKLAYLTEQRAERFRSEAMASLPRVADFQEAQFVDAVFAGLRNQRIRLKINQQIAEWEA